MARARAIGSCLIAALALSAGVGVSAQAKKWPGGGAVYLEWKGPESRLATSKETIRSSQSTGRAEIYESQGGSAVLTFEGVEAAGGSKCHSAEEPPGAVVTHQLEVETGWISKPKGEAGIDFRPASSSTPTDYADFECEGLGVKLKGSVIAHLSPINLMTRDMTMDLFGAEGTFRNEPASFEGGSPDVLKAELSTSPGTEAEAVLEQRNVDLHDHGSPIFCRIRKGIERCKPAFSELNTVFNPAQPEFGWCRKRKGGKFSEANCASLAEPGKGKFEFNPVPI